MNRPAQGAHRDLSMRTHELPQNSRDWTVTAHIFILISFQVLAPLRRGSLFYSYRAAVEREPMDNEAREREPIDRMRARLEALLRG